MISYSPTMTELLDQALRSALRLSPAMQDELARVILNFAEPTPLTQSELEALDRSEAAAARGDFATDEEVRAVWAKHGL